MMSEVKPTLVSYSAVGETTPLNSWLSNFPSGKWIDAQSRNWYWIMVNVVNVSSAYEYRVKFDIFAEDMTLIFPFVVKTSDKGVKKVFINGVEYRVRSKENYGDRFVVSGQEFSFRVATEYKLTKETAPLLILKYRLVPFKAKHLLDIGNYHTFRRIFPEFNTINTMNIMPIGMRDLGSNFVSLVLMDSKCVRTRALLSMFYNTNLVDTNLLPVRTISGPFYNTKMLQINLTSMRAVLSDFHNIQTMRMNLLSMRFAISRFYNTNTIQAEIVLGGIVSSTFNNINNLSVLVIANCRDTSWARFGSVWKSCETWISLI